MSNVRFTGHIIYDEMYSKLTPSHYTYLQGWMSEHFSNHPEHRHFLMVVRPMASSVVEIELYDPGTVVHTHVETRLAPVIMNVIAPKHAEEEKDDEDGPGFMEPAIGEA